MKIHIDNINITMPPSRETKPELTDRSVAKDNPFGIDTNALSGRINELLGINSKLLAENAELRKTNAKLRSNIYELSARVNDIPANTVLTSYHDEIVEEWNKSMLTLSDKYKRRGDALNELTAAVTGLRGKVITIKGSYENESKEHSKTLSNLRNEKGNVIGLKATIKSLEDKVAGYELGMSKEQVAKECGTKPPLTRRPLLSDEEVWQLRRFFKRGRKDVWIIDRTGLPATTVNKVRHNQSYASVPAEPESAPICLHVGWEATKQTKGESK
ncbi:MAG: hypothetical protein DRI24_17935 [Deltaproteobacteria bacterium]|nr:MAG: hypothetical protein DRI24_17935 [Deltaproteobacteria bacterium]